MKLLQTLDLLLLLCAPLAHATWSIIAFDPSRQLFGVCAVTCITLPEFHDRFLQETYFYDDEAAIMAQAWYTDVQGLQQALNVKNERNATAILEYLLTVQDDICFDPFAAVIDEIEYTCASPMDEEFPLPEIRQYGIVTVAGETASYTGPKLDPLYNIFSFPTSEQTSQEGTTANDVKYSVQGNVVFPGTVAAVAVTEECDLAETLLSAMEAGVGDVRCAETNKTSTVGFLKIVDIAQQLLLVDIEAESNFDSPEKGSLEMLRDKLNMQQRNNCTPFEDNEGGPTPPEKSNGQRIGTSTSFCAFATIMSAISLM